MYTDNWGPDKLSYTIADSDSLVEDLWYPRYGLGMGLLMAMLVVIANEYVVKESALEVNMTFS